MVEAEEAVAVPETVPLVVLKLNPAGNAGEIEYEVGVVDPSAVDVPLA